MPKPPPPLPRLSKRLRALVGVPQAPPMPHLEAPPLLQPKELDVPASRPARPSGSMKAQSAPLLAAAPLVPIIRAEPTPVSLSEAKGARTVLVVDDDEAIRRLMVRALRTLYTVYEASDGEEASLLLDAHPQVDCVVLDIMMPKLSGTELARKMRSDAHLKHVPVVFVTAKKSTGDMAEGISLGARFYLSKPFSLKTLFAKVGEAMT